MTRTKNSRKSNKKNNKRKSQNLRKTQTTTQISPGLMLTISISRRINKGTRWDSITLEQPESQQPKRTIKTLQYNKKRLLLTDKLTDLSVLLITLPLILKSQTKKIRTKRKMPRPNLKSKSSNGSVNTTKSKRRNKGLSTKTILNSWLRMVRLPI